MQKKIKFIEAKSELGAGTRGASLGIDAIKVASLNKNNYLFKNYEKLEIPVDNERLWNDIICDNAKRIQGIHHVLTNISEGVYKNVITHFPIVLSGDHSCAAGTIAGIKKAYPDKRLGVIWIDAHADLHTPYTTPSGNMHGMPLAIALAENNLESQQNNPKTLEISEWENLKSIGIVGPKFNPQDLIYFVVRDTETPEDEYIVRHGVKNYTYSEIKQRGLEACAHEALEKLKNCDLIYVSFDVDSMDSKFSKGTGTPVVNGLTPEEAVKLNAILVANEKVCCWEAVEVNPTLDSENKMAEYCFDVVEKVVKTVENRK